MKLRALTLLVFLALPTLARAGGVVAITDGTVTQYNDALGAAREVLRDLIVIDQSAADAPDALRKIDPNVILAVGQKALQLARQVLPERPIVYCIVLGPQAVATRNVTGVRLEVSPALQLERIKQVHPSVKRVGTLYDPRTSGAFMEEAVRAAGRLGLTLVAKPVLDIKEVPSALSEIAESIDTLWLISDPRLISPDMFTYVLVFTLERKIALFGFLDAFTRAGALASIAPDYQESGRRAARIAQELSQKSPEGRLPVPAPVFSPGALTVNTKTARQLGVEIPADVLAKARQVYR